MSITELTLLTHMTRVQNFGYLVIWELCIRRIPELIYLASMYLTFVHFVEWYLWVFSFSRYLGDFWGVDRL